MENLSEGERDFLGHIRMFGSDGYPVSKLGRGWQFNRFFGVGGTPVVYRTKREAVAAVELYLSILRDKAAGRI